MKKTAIALGTFDGVHKGHRAVLSLPEDCEKIAVTFERPPKAEWGEAGLLMSYAEKCRILQKLGMNRVIGLSFKDVCDMPPRDFLLSLKERFSPSFLSCGFNYRFGKAAAGNTAQLEDFCRENGMTFQCCQPVLQNGKVVSSTEIRRLLEEGETEKANALMTENFSFSTEVIAGDRRGRTLGFPTINQKYPEELTRLRFGVYRTRVLFDGKSYTGLTNVGLRPTYLSDQVLSETHILGFSGDLYGKNVRIEPLNFIRAERKFSSAAELKAQIAKDRAFVLK